jgi:hypothetical protein
MEVFPMLMDWQNQYCENVYTNKKAIYISNAIPIKIPITFITKIENQPYSSYRNIKDHKQPRQY